MNSDHCWVRAVFGIELMLVNLENPNCPSVHDLKELGACKCFELVLFTVPYTDLIITVGICFVKLVSVLTPVYSTKLILVVLLSVIFYFTHFLTFRLL